MDACFLWIVQNLDPFQCQPGGESLSKTSHHSWLMNPSPTWNTLSGDYDGFKKRDLHISIIGLV